MTRLVNNTVARMGVRDGFYKAPIRYAAESYPLDKLVLNLFTVQHQGEAVAG